MLLTVAFGTRNTGLDVYYQLLNADKSVYAARTQNGVTELITDSGCYGVTLVDAVIAGKTIVWDIDGTAKTASETFPSSVEDFGDLAIAIVDALGGPNVDIVFVNPVLSGGDVAIIQGDAYFASEGRDLSWEDTSNLWPDLAGVTVAKLVVKTSSGHVILKKALTITPVGNHYKVWIELAHTDTEKLDIGEHVFFIQVIISSREVTIANGTFTVSDGVANIQLS